MNQAEYIEKAREWAETDLPGTTYYWSDPNDEGKTITSKLPPNCGTYSYTTTHRVEIMDCNIIEKMGEDSVLIGLEVLAYYSCSEDDDVYGEEVFYLLRIFDDGEIDLKASRSGADYFSTELNLIIEEIIDPDD